MGDQYLAEIQAALGLEPHELARELGVPVANVLDRHGPRAAQTAMDDDPFWILLREYVDTRIGVLIGIRADMARRIRLDQAKRAKHRRRIQER